MRKEVTEVGSGGASDEGVMGKWVSGDGWYAVEGLGLIAYAGSKRGAALPEPLEADGVGVEPAFASLIWRTESWSLPSKGKYCWKEMVAGEEGRPKGSLSPAWEAKEAGASMGMKHSMT